MSTYVVHPNEEQEKVIRSFFEEQGIPFFKEEEEVLPDHVLAGIARGQEDIKAGRSISFDEFKKRLSSAK